MMNKIDQNADLDLMTKNELHEEHSRLTMIVVSAYPSRLSYKMNERADLICEKLGLGVLNGE